MTDKPLFIMDTDARWRLAYDANQWVLQQRRGKARASHIEGRRIARSGYEAVSFIGSTKRVLTRVLGERGVVLTPEAQTRLDALPERFMDFVEVPASFATQLEAEAA
jgi:hypothetical protein